MGNVIADGSATDGGHAAGAPQPYDLLIVGGGINGTAIARAAAIAGAKVLLVEQGDLAQATSSASTKLMHGGLRYLERLEFRLVHESLIERDIMLRTAPHLVHPLEFRIPHQAHMRPWPIMRIGLWLYDLLAMRGNLPRSRSVVIEDAALTDSGCRGFSYWDARVDDARLVVLNAVDAAAAGATIRTRTRFEGALRGADSWTATLSTPHGEVAVSARSIVNAAGPWVEQVLQNTCARPSAVAAPEASTRRQPSRLRLVRGSHIIVRRCFDGDHAYLLEQPDGRIVFAIPYQHDHTLIGTTDAPAIDPTDAAVSQAEIEYLLGAVNRYRREPLAAGDIVHHYAGIRALYDDGAGSASAVSRDYHLDLDSAGPPILNIFGGKITTARHLAEAALDMLGVKFGLGLKFGDTRNRCIPGGDMTDFAAFLAAGNQRWPFIAGATLERLAGAYGTRIWQLLGDAETLDDLGKNFGADLHAREVDYLMENEWAASAEDILWRRSKLGLRLTAGQATVLQAYIEGRGQ